MPLEPPPPELVVFVGLQGAGKTTLFRERFGESHLHVSRDLFPSARDPRARQRRLVSEGLEAGRSVVVDNTHPGPADRAELLALGRAHQARTVAYYFVPDLRGSLARNAGRQGRARVPEVAIFATRKRLVPPSHAEGFDRVIEVRVEAEGFRLRELQPGEEPSGPS
jgi:predicted kinase